MEIGNIKEFKEQQLGKVEKRKKEDQKIKKGIYQMQVMIDAQDMETFTKERERAERRTSRETARTDKPDAGNKESKRTDARTEMEKMLSAGSKFIHMNSKIV